MRIIFAGTPDYAVPSLKKLHALAPRHEVVAVVSQPDKPKGRSGHPTPPPVVDAARKLGIPNERIFQPKSINKREILESLAALSPDLLCVVAYGGLLKQKALSLAKLYPINAHGSILPRHRGAAPIQAALLAGDTETGVCIMKMELGLDTGPVLLCRKTPILPSDDAGTLHDRLAELSADCFVEAVEIITTGPVTFTPQDQTQASYAAKLEKNSGRIDWNRDGAYLERFIRAMNPWPGAWTALSLPDGSQTVRLRVVRASFEGAQSGTCACSGRVRGEGNDAVLLATAGDGTTLAIREIQPEGKRPMSVAEFLRGAGRKFISGLKWA